MRWLLTISLPGLARCARTPRGARGGLWLPAGAAIVRSDEDCREPPGSRSGFSSPAAGRLPLRSASPHRLSKILSPRRARWPSPAVNFLAARRGPVKSGETAHSLGHRLKLGGVR